MNHSSSQAAPDTLQRPNLKLFALASPPLLAVAHVFLYVVHRAIAGSAPAEIPGELISLVIFLIVFHVVLYRRGAPLGLQAVALIFPVVSLALAPLAGFIFVVLISAC